MVKSVGGVSEEYMKQFRVAFGKAVSVSRAVHTHTQGEIQGSTNPVIVNGTTLVHGNAGGGKITTTNTTWESAIIISEDGTEYPLKVEIQEPFLREGSDVALTLRNGMPVVVTNLNSKYRYWINGGPEPEFALKWWGWLWFVPGAALLVVLFNSSFSSHESLYLTMFSGLALIGVGIVSFIARQYSKAKRTRNGAARTAFLNGEINKRIPGWS